jgi:hypothetical protein
VADVIRSSAEAYSCTAGGATRAGADTEVQHHRLLI